MKTWLITGCSSGLGRGIAKAVLRRGDWAAVTARDPAELNTLAQAYPERVLPLRLDLTDRESMEQAVHEICQHFGSIDVLVNNAGITRDGLMARMSEEQFDIVTNVNYKSVFNMMRHTSGVMIRQKSGRIINISSVAGLYGNPGQINYSAAKAGIIGMTKTAAKELGSRGITVNAVAPGFVQTPMTDVLDEKYKEAIIGNIALKRFGQPEDIANAVAFFASEQASYVTGQVLEVSGGMTM